MHCDRNGDRETAMESAVPRGCCSHTIDDLFDPILSDCGARDIVHRGRMNVAHLCGTVLALTQSNAIMHRIRAVRGVCFSVNFRGLFCNHLGLRCRPSSPLVCRLRFVAMSSGIGLQNGTKKKCIPMQALFFPVLVTREAPQKSP